MSIAMLAVLRVLVGDAAFLWLDQRSDRGDIVDIGVGFDNWRFVTNSR
jgi:hypothetical protein